MHAVIVTFSHKLAVIDFGIYLMQYSLVMRGIGLILGFYWFIGENWKKCKTLMFYVTHCSAIKTHAPVSILKDMEGLTLNFSEKCIPSMLQTPTIISHFFLASVYNTVVWLAMRWQSFLADLIQWIFLIILFVMTAFLAFIIKHSRLSNQLCSNVTRYCSEM